MASTWGVAEVSPTCAGGEGGDDGLLAAVGDSAVRLLLLQQFRWGRRQAVRVEAWVSEGEVACGYVQLLQINKRSKCSNDSCSPHLQDFFVVMFLSQPFTANNGVTPFIMIHCK